MDCGIVGLPNVGKSTLFNALTATAQAQAANYPFCTIEPNKGTVCVPDPRLQNLAKCAGSALVVPTQLTFVDIAGLVKGASQGEGLGNQFLSHIRQVDALVHVVRCFEGEVIHVAGRINPLDDIDVVEMELMLADLQSLEGRLGRRKGTEELRPLLEKAYQALSQGQWASQAEWSESEKKFWPQLDLLTLKPMLYVCNTAEGEQDNPWVAQVRAHGQQMGRIVLTVCSQLEAEIASLPAEERQGFLTSMGIEETGLSQIIKATYDLLGLLSFFTAGPKETRAWTLRRGTAAPEAAGVIHTDFQRGFIRAEVISYEDYIACTSAARAKEEGKVRVEGKDYIVQDGDTILFRFNV